jgi:tetratricopeptide (TPR) repeat protein
MNQSLAQLREASALMESLAHEDPSALRYQRPYALVLSYLGICLREMGKFDEAVSELSRAVAVSEGILAAHPGDVVGLARLTKSESELSGALVSKKDFAGALAHAQHGLVVALKNADGPELGIRLRYLGNSYDSLAYADRALGHWQAARDHAQSALDTWDRSGGKDVDTRNRQQASAILAESAKYLK